MAAAVAIFSASSISFSRHPSNTPHELAGCPMVNFSFLCSPKLVQHRDMIVRNTRAISAYRRLRMHNFVVASRSDSTELDVQSSAASLWEEDGEWRKAASAAMDKIGARVRVKVPLKVFHIPKVPVADLIGKEGLLMQYVGFWKGKRLSANLPFKVAFVIEVEGRGPVKFFAHLKEEEFDYLENV